jgi:hypothetical protein
MAQKPGCSRDDENRVFKSAGVLFRRLSLVRRHLEWLGLNDCLMISNGSGGVAGHPPNKIGNVEETLVDHWRGTAYGNSTHLWYALNAAFGL